MSSYATPDRPRLSRRQRLSSWAGFGLITVGTTLAALLEMSVSGTLGWLTGAIFTVLSALAALTLRRQDLITAVISPPLGYLFAVIFSAQVAVVGSSGNFWLLQATTILSGLAFNAQWVFLGTAAGLIVMVIRRVSDRREHDPEHAPALHSGTDHSL